MLLAPSAHDQRRAFRTASGFSLGSQSKKGTDQSNALYKTELCRSFNEVGSCRYGLKCRFAHGDDDLRPVARHKKYKTEPCKNYSRDGNCLYGSRCRFLHDEDDTRSVSTNTPSSLSENNLFDFGVHAQNKSNSWSNLDIVSQSTTQDTELFGTSSSTRVFATAKILPMHFKHYGEDPSWQSLVDQPRRRPSLSLSSIPNQQPSPLINSLASTTVASTPFSSNSPVSQSSVFQSAPRKSIIGFAPTNPSSSFKSSMEALEPETDSPTAEKNDDTPLPQLPSFFTNGTPSVSPTQSDPIQPFEEVTSKKNVVSSLSLSLSLARNGNNGVSLGLTPVTVKSSPEKKLSIIEDDLLVANEDLQVFSIPRRRTQSMSMSLPRNTSLFSDFQNLSISKSTPPKPEILPEVPKINANTNHAVTILDYPNGNDKIITIPSKRLPIFATLAISPKLEAPSP